MKRAFQVACLILLIVLASACIYKECEGGGNGLSDITEDEAKEIALKEWWKDRVMIPENRAIATAEDKGDHWLVTVKITEMFTNETVTEDAGQYKIDKATGEIL